MLDVNKVEGLYLGVRGENQARTIQINVRPWVTEHPNASFSIWHKRPGASTKEVTGAAYDPTEGTVEWIPSSVDTYNAGEGLAEIRMTEGNVIKKSRDVKTLVSPSVIGSGGTISESDWQSYMDAVDLIRQQAQMKVYDAEAWADGTRNGQPVDQTDETYENNARFWAMEAAGAPEAEITAERWAVGQRKGIDVGPDDVTYHNNAKYYADEARDAVGELILTAEESEAWAVGTKNGEDVGPSDPEYHNNSKYYAGLAGGSADSAADDADDAEAWAVGTVDGEDVPATADQYHNNAKYYAEQAADSETAAAESADSAADDADDAEAWAKGTVDGQTVPATADQYHNNSKYYAEQAAGSATSAASAIGNMTVDAENVSSGSSASAVISEVNGHKHIHFAIPRGADGRDGIIADIDMGLFSMAINTDGDLICTYNTEAPSLSIDSNGDLIYTV